MTNRIAAPNAIVAVLHSYAQAEARIGRLRGSGFDLTKLSVVARDCPSEQQMVAYYGPAGQARCWGRNAAFWNGVWGVLSGWAVLVIPDAAPILVAGPLGEWVVAAIRNSAVFGGLNALGAVLYGLGIPKAAALRCEAAVKSDKILLIAHGAAGDIGKAAEILTWEEAEPDSSLGQASQSA